LQGKKFAGNIRLIIIPVEAAIVCAWLTARCHDGIIRPQANVIATQEEGIVRKLALVSLLCLALLAACLGCSKETATSGSAVFTVNGETGLAAAIALTDNHIQSMVNTMQVLAMTDEVKAGSWEGMQGILGRFSQDQIPAAVWFALPDGSYYTVEVGKASGNLSDRAYFPKVMAGATSIGDLVVSKSTGKKSVIATVPVKNGGQVIGALGASIYLDSLSTTVVDEMQLPDNMVFYAIDGEGNIALDSDTQVIMQKASDLGSSSFSQAVDEMLSNKEGNTTYELGGMSDTVVYKTSPLTNWCFALGVKTK
jgi:hypothetical protein